MFGWLLIKSAQNTKNNYCFQYDSNSQIIKVNRITNYSIPPVSFNPGFGIPPYHISYNLEVQEATNESVTLKVTHQPKTYKYGIIICITLLTVALVQVIFIAIYCYIRKKQTNYEPAPEV